jgi:hypothetical protein
MFWFLAALATLWVYSKVDDPKPDKKPNPESTLPKRGGLNHRLVNNRDGPRPRPGAIAARMPTEAERKVMSRTNLDEEARRMQQYVITEFYSGNNAGGGKAHLLNPLKSQISPAVVTYNKLPLVQPEVTRVDVSETPALVPIGVADMRMAPSLQLEEEPRRTAEITSEIMGMLSGGLKKNA